MSLDVTNQLLDLICFYGDHDPAQENVPEQKNEETVGQTMFKMLCCFGGTRQIIDEMEVECAA